MHRVLYLLMSWTLLVGRELSLRCIHIQDRPLINFLPKWMGKYLDSEGIEGADWYFECLHDFFSSLTPLIFFFITFQNIFKDINLK